MTTQAAKATGNCAATTVSIGDKRTHNAAPRAELTPEEFVAAVEQYKDEFYRFVTRTAWNPATIDDIFSSAVLSAYENRAKFTRGTNFRAWMYRILLNKCYAANRDARRRVATPQDFGIGMADTSADFESVSALENPEDALESCSDAVRFALDELSTAERACILLRGIDGFSYKEIAEALDIPVATVMTHLHRGRVKLRKALRPYAKGQGLAATA